MIAVPFWAPVIGSNVQEGCFTLYVFGPDLTQTPRQTLPVEGGGVSLRISVPSPLQESKPSSTVIPPEVKTACHSPTIELPKGLGPGGPSWSATSLKTPGRARWPGTATWTVPFEASPWVPQSALAPTANIKLRPANASASFPEFEMFMSFTFLSP